MAKRLRTVAVILGVILMLPVLPACGGGRQGPTILSAANGAVSVFRPGNAAPVPGTPGMTIKPGDVVVAGNNSTAMITFFEGSTMELEAGASIEVVSLKQAKSGSTTLLLKQTLGDTVSRVTKLVDANSRYEIETPAAVAAVRGSSMAVKVVRDGTTTVANIDGAISVKAQGQEVVIPQGKHSTVIPGQTPGAPAEGTAATLLTTPVLADSLDDLFDTSRVPVTGPDYLDIESSQIYFINEKWVMRMNLRGAPPRTDSVSSQTLIEWCFMIDIDRDPATGLRRPFIANDIGYDYLVRFSLENNTYRAELIELAAQSTEAIEYTIRGSTLEMVIPLISRDGSPITPPAIDWAVATIYYKDTDPRDMPSFTDKAPNEGHYVFP